MAFRKKRSNTPQRFSTQHGDKLQEGEVYDDLQRSAAVSELGNTSCNTKDHQTMQAGHSQPGGLNSSITAWDSSVFAPILSNVSVIGDINISQKTDTRLSTSKSTDITSVINEYKESTVSEYSYTSEYTSRPGEHVLLQDRYIDPLIIKSHRKKKEQEEEMRSKGNQFFNLRTNRSISIAHLFDQQDSSGTCPKSVILQGNSGNGKSFTAQKIILDWAKGDLFKEMFDLVFHLRCSELNGISEDISLAEFLNCSDEMTQILKDKQQKILFLIDGFDELRLKLPSKPLPVSAEIKAKPGAVLSSLLRGTMLKQSFILVTTRSVATDHLGKLLKIPQRFTEIVGFSEKGVQEYFYKFFADKKLADKVHEQLKTNEVLYTACFSPVMCWLICSVFKQKGETYTKTTAGLESSTSVLVDFVFTLLEHHCQGLNQSQQLILVKNLGQIAEKGMLEGQVFFDKHVLQEFITDPVCIPFICIHHHKERMNVKERFSFIHLSFQEFFTAFFYILLDKDQARAKVRTLLFSSEEQRHLLPVIQFLFGLVNMKASALLEEKFQHVVSHEVCALLEEWIYTRAKLRNYWDEFKLLCLYEIKNDSIVSKAMQIWEKNEDGIRLWLGSSQRSDFLAAVYCLQFISSIRSLNLNECTMENVRMLRPALRKCDELRLVLSPKLSSKA